jgi:hypothetical protein
MQKRKLIEVALPLEAINRESAREKSLRHGHPSTLHLWWARRPLAAARAVLFAQLVHDPSSQPEKFPTEEAQKPSGSVSTNSSRNCPIAIAVNADSMSTWFTTVFEQLPNVLFRHPDRRPGPLGTLAARRCGHGSGDDGAHTGAGCRVYALGCGTCQ